MPIEKKSTTLISLPYQMASVDELKGCDDIEILSYQLRIGAVEQIRLIQAGKLALTESVKKNLMDTNRLLKEFGKPTLPLDF